MSHIEFNSSPITKWLLFNTKSAFLWLIIRIYIGLVWIETGLEKVFNPAWTGENAGGAISGFVNGALQKTTGAHPDVQMWYAFFLENFVLPNASIFSYLIAYGELLVGLALIIGIFTGLAAFFGSFMNLNFLLAGTVSLNPVMLPLSILLILAWRVAGYFGLDYYVLPSFEGSNRVFK